MRKEIVFIFALILISGLVVADSPLPVLPASYFGKITVNNEPIADGYFVTGKINGVVLDSCRTSGGLYGSGKDTLIVTSGNPNAIVEFYIGNVKIGEHVFEGMEVIEVDFDLNETPEYPGMPVDGVCDVEGGECLYNSEDCNPSKTDACSNNGRCDTEIGETCSNTPEDCGSCPSEETSAPHRWDT